MGMRLRDILGALYGVLPAFLTRFAPYFALFFIPDWRVASDRYRGRVLSFHD